MKTTLKLLAISCVCVLVMGACGSGSNENDSTQEKKLSAKKNYRDDYRKACEDLEFGEAHKILDKKRDYYVEHGLKETAWGQYNTMTGYQEYVDADIFIFREEVTYLMSMDDPNVENRIFKLLMEMPMDGTLLDEGYQDYDIVSSPSNPTSRQAWTYYYCIKRYNEKCNIILDLSILFEKQSLAKKVLSYYKDNMHIEDTGEGKKITVRGKSIKMEPPHYGIYVCYVWYDTADKDAAQKKYDEAVKNGLFN